MTMKARMVTVDCADPDELASWWAAAIDGTVHAVYPGWFVIVGAEPISMGFQKVPDSMFREDVSSAHEHQHSTERRDQAERFM